MGQGITKCFVGLSDHTAESNERNALPSLWLSNFKVVISLEVGLPTIRIEAYDISHNEEVLARDLDLANERRENTLIRMVDYHKH